MTGDARRRLCVFDLDGVLIVGNEVSSEALENLLRCVERGLGIAIVSGRRVSEWRRIRSMLRDAGAPLDSIVVVALRESDEDPRSFKLRTLSELTASGFEVVEVHEDDADLARRLSAMLRNACIYLYSSGRLTDVVYPRRDLRSVFP